MGSHICDTLLGRGDAVRALVLPGDKSVKYIPNEVDIVEGNLCDADSLETFFTVPKGVKTIAIHCASMVTTNAEFNQKLIDVNVGGTKNMIDKCLEHKSLSLHAPSNDKKTFRNCSPTLNRSRSG